MANEIESTIESTAGATRPRTPSLGLQARRVLIEVIVGAAIGLAILLAVIASTGKIPFVYQGY